MIKIPSTIILCLHAAVGLRVDDAQPPKKVVKPTPSPYCANSLSWPAPPVARGAPSEYAVVTYAGIEKQSYIDGAIMLRRSFEASPKSVHFVCLVGRTMSAENKDSLKNAGWDVQEVDIWCPLITEQKHPLGYWSQSYEKINAFGLQFKSVLFMDADTWAVSDDAATKLLDKLKDFGDSGKSDQILMAPDVNSTQGWNSGVMIFSPSEAKFNQVATIMETNGWLDQPTINKAYEGKIQALDQEYNVHGWLRDYCDKAIVAHFTGMHKPTWADPDCVRMTREGKLSEVHNTNLKCPQLYTAFYERLKIEETYLTPSLRDLVNADKMKMLVQELLTKAAPK